jgi:hypothetical protein
VDHFYSFHTSLASGLNNGPYVWWPYPFLHFCGDSDFYNQILATS